MNNAYFYQFVQKILTSKMTPQDEELHPLEKNAEKKVSHSHTFLLFAFKYTTDRLQPK